MTWDDTRRTISILHNTEGSDEKNIFILQYDTTTFWNQTSGNPYQNEGGGLRKKNYIAQVLQEEWSENPKFRITYILKISFHNTKN